MTSVSTKRNSRPSLDLPAGGFECLGGFRIGVGLRSLLLGDWSRIGDGHAGGAGEGFFGSRPAAQR